MRRKIVLAFMLFLLMVFAVIIVLSMEDRPHAFPRCSLCHVSENPSGTTARMMNAPITSLCADNCHQDIFEEGYMHPVDVRPERVAVPSDMPVSLSGELSCATCHNVHADYYTPYGAASHFLRRQEAGKEFCKICHPALFSARGGHQASLGEAHFRSRYVATASSQEIDPLSKNCVTCHDGSYATSATVMVGSWTHEKSFIRNDHNSHPIGVHYESVRVNRGAKTDLRPLVHVDRRIRFFNGKVGCGSCHDPYSALHMKLVMSDENSRLCVACHIV